MRVFSLLSSFLLAGAAVAQNTSCSPKSSDVEVVRYAWALQAFLERFYANQPLNQTFLSNATNSSTADYFTNLQGMQRQNRLGVRAVQQLSAKVSNFSQPSCNYTFPNSTSGEAFVTTAASLESSVAGALIGATGYTQAPEVSFLLARLAAQHTASATWLSTQQTSVLFPTNSTGLIAAYNPSYVLSNGTQPGKLGRYLHGCVTAPANPCGETFFISSLIGSLGNATATSGGSISLASISPTAVAAKRLFSG